MAQAGFATDRGTPGVQQGTLSAPHELDGHATLSVGTLSLNEGRDFTLLRSSGEWVQGQLTHAQPGGKGKPTGDVILFGNNRKGVTTVETMRTIPAPGAKLLIGLEDSSTRELLASSGGRTVILTGPEGEAAGMATSAVTVDQATMSKLLAVRDGEAVVLTVHPQQQRAPGSGSGSGTTSRLHWLEQSSGSAPSARAVALTLASGPR